MHQKYQISFYLNYINFKMFQIFHRITNSFHRTVKSDQMPHLWYSYTENIAFGMIGRFATTICIYFSSPATLYLVNIIKFVMSYRTNRLDWKPFFQYRTLTNFTKVLGYRGYTTAYLNPHIQWSGCPINQYFCNKDTDENFHSNLNSGGGQGCKIG